MTWDIKRLKIMLEEDENFTASHELSEIDFEVFNDGYFSIFAGEHIHIENMSIDVAKRLRDFLNYAIKDGKVP